VLEMGWAGIRVKGLRPGSQGKKVEKVFACVVGWLFVCLFVDGFGFCCCWWLAGWLAIQRCCCCGALWWAASVAAAVAAADAVLARTLMLVLQPLDPWEAPRPRAPPLCWSPPGPLAAALHFPATGSPKPKQKEFSFLSGTIHLPLFLSLSLSLSFFRGFLCFLTLATTGRVSFVAISLFGHTHGEMQSCVQNDDRH